MAMDPDTALMLEALSKCSVAIADTPPSKRQRVLAALNHLFPVEPIPHEPPLSSEDRSILDRLRPIGPGLVK